MHEVRAEAFFLELYLHLPQLPASHDMHTPYTHTPMMMYEYHKIDIRLPRGAMLLLRRDFR